MRVSDDSVKRILILSANPKGTSQLRLDEEVREIKKGLRLSRGRDRFHLESEWAVRPDDLRRALLEVQPHIVHFCGHGEAEGLLLEDETGHGQSVSAAALADLFRLCADSLVCVLLNACYSEPQAEAIAHHVPYVIGMTQAIGDRAAIQFAVGFYEALGANRTLSDAFQLGCNAIQLTGRLGAEVPVLKRQPSTLPDQPLFPISQVTSRPCPYQGLAAFQEEDAPFFFGREGFVQRLVEAVESQPLVMVLGPSGSGKSSVVFAGLVPQVRSRPHWRVVTCRPKHHPLHELAHALIPLLEPHLSGTDQRRAVQALAHTLQATPTAWPAVLQDLLHRHAPARLLLIIDQFEELYSAGAGEAERRIFLDLLLNLSHSCDGLNLACTVVLTLRADFYGYVLASRPFRDLLQHYPPLLVSAMNHQELQAAIEKPAQHLGVSLEPRLTQRLLDDVGQEPGNLPLLEFALERLWHLQHHHHLTHRAYDDIGGIRQALANHAEAVYTTLSPLQQRQAQRLLLQLVRPGDGTDDTRRVALRSELGDVWDVVSVLAACRARLVVTGRGDAPGSETVELVHEALIREWQRLQGWMESDRTFRLWQERLRTAQRQWEMGGRQEADLLHGSLLQAAEDQWKPRLPDLSAAEQTFIRLSWESRDRLQHQELHRERVKTRWALTAAGMAIATLIAGGVAWEQTHQQHIQERQFLIAMQDMSLGEPRLDILPTLPDLLKEADRLRQQQQIDQALDFYQNILSFTSSLQQKLQHNSDRLSTTALGNISVDQLSMQIKEVSQQAETALIDIIRRERLPILERELRDSQFGAINPNAVLTDFEQQFTPGALKTTYAILLRESGAKADLNNDGVITNQQEADRMPCESLQAIEALWRYFTEQKCGWYGDTSPYYDPNCTPLGGDTLTSILFPAPKEFAINRLNACQISSQP